MQDYAESRLCHEQAACKFPRVQKRKAGYSKKNPTLSFLSS